MIPALSITGLEKTYDNGFRALKRLNLEVAQGAFFALLGPNGAGKSTTIGVISSLVAKSAGKVLVHGVDIDEDFPGAKKYLGIVPQEFNFSVFEKPEDMLVQQAGFYGIPLSIARERTKHFLGQLGLAEKSSTPARMLSGGMKRRLMIARALIHAPKLLILDEPTAGVDIEMRRSMYDFLREINAAGTTIILTTHYLEEAEALCRNMAIINHGEIVANTSIRELLRDLNKESFLLDCQVPLPGTITVEGFHVAKVDEHTIEVHIEKGQDLVQAFEGLKQQGIKVLSMRNQANRLEQMFVSVLEQQA